MKNTTTARWYGDTLLVKWYGSDQEDDAATLTFRDGEVNPWRLVFEGSDETFVKDYAEEPTAERALADITNWQFGY